MEPFDILVWTAGSGGNELAKMAGIATNSAGKIPVDAFLRVRDHDGVYSLGDTAECFDALGDKMAPNAQVCFGCVSGSVGQSACMLNFCCF